MTICNQKAMAEIFRNWSIKMTKLKTLILASAISCASIGANAQDYSTASTNHLLTGALTAMSIDWLQTRYIVTHPREFHETNPMLGQHPSMREVNQHFAVAIIGTVIAAKILPERYSRLFLSGVISIEGSFISGNQRLSIGVQF
jgi:hypothetical protein